MVYFFFEKNGVPDGPDRGSIRDGPSLIGRHTNGFVCPTRLCSSDPYFVETIAVFGTYLFLNNLDRNYECT